MYKFKQSSWTWSYSCENDQIHPDKIDTHITNIFNKGFKEILRYSKSDETAIVDPIYKNSWQYKDRGNIKNCRTVSILTDFSKIHERLLRNN